MKIYTRTGDRGSTAVTGARVSKSSPVVTMLGELDELNTTLGLSCAEVKKLPENNVTLSSEIVQVQSFIFRIGTVIADPTLSRAQSKTFIVDCQAAVARVEMWIDKAEEQLPELKNFILPGGCEAAARLHLSRAVCRRVERACVAYASTLSIENKAVTEAQTYLNRLSDLLFVWARLTNYLQEIADEVWTSD